MVGSFDKFTIILQIFYTSVSNIAPVEIDTFLRPFILTLQPTDLQHE